MTPAIVFESQTDDPAAEFRSFAFAEEPERWRQVHDFVAVDIADLVYDGWLPGDSEEASLAFLRDRLLSLAGDVEARRRWLAAGDAAEPVRLAAPW